MGNYLTTVPNMCPFLVSSAQNTYSAEILITHNKVRFFKS